MPSMLANQLNTRSLTMMITGRWQQFHQISSDVMLKSLDQLIVINALNSGADIFLADFEDSLSPTWKNIVEGQANLIDAERGTISFRNADGIFLAEYIL
jgi:malate synthase